MSYDPGRYFETWSSFDAYNEYTMTNNCFHQVIKLSDEFFLREVLLRPSVEEYRQGARKADRTFLIFDGAFEKVGETRLPPDTYYPQMSFVVDGQLHLANAARYSEDENALVFDRFGVRAGN